MVIATSKLIFPAVRTAVLPPGPPLLQVVVDTEEEFDWAAPFNRASTATTAIAAQGLAQAIFTPYGLRPTYVIDYPVATTPSAIAVLKGFRDAGQCQIGAHLHPWVTPPHDEAVNDVNSYAGNRHPTLERVKIARLTAAITENFDAAPIIFKAGRYGLGSQTAATLAELGYRGAESNVRTIRYWRCGFERSLIHTAVLMIPRTTRQIQKSTTIPRSIRRATCRAGAGRYDMVRK